MSETTNTTDFLDIYRKAALFISPNIFQEIKTNYTRFIKDRQPERYIYEHHLKGWINILFFRLFGRLYALRL